MKRSCISKAVWWQTANEQPSFIVDLLQCSKEKEHTRVTRKTTKNLTLPIEEPSTGINLTRTFDNVSPTTTLYEIIAAEMKKMFLVILVVTLFRDEKSLDLVTPNKPLRKLSKFTSSFSSYLGTDTRTGETKANNSHRCRKHSPWRSGSFAGLINVLCRSEYTIKRFTW